jgi:carbon storage regulator CsrA
MELESGGVFSHVNSEGVSMLILAREVGQEVVIGEGADLIRVVVLDIKGDRVRLGFHCQTHMPIDRLEVRIRKDQSKEKQDDTEATTDTQ